MNGTSKELVEVLKDSTSISSIYQGITLVWGKKEQEANFSGKFIAKATSADYFYYTNEFQGTIKNFAVDEGTKEFSIYTKDIPFLTQNHNVKEITAFPYNPEVTSYKSMFSHCESMTYLNGEAFNTEYVVNMDGMFSACYSIPEMDLSSWNTKALEVLSSTFSYCSQLTTLNLSGWNTSNVRSFYGCFQACYVLENLNIDGWDFSKATSLGSMFSSCRTLKNVTGTISGITYNIDISDSPLTNDSAMVFINGLKTNATTLTRKITFSKATYNTLTDEQKAIATDKGWTIASK